MIPLILDTQVIHLFGEVMDQELDMEQVPFTEQVAQTLSPLEMEMLDMFIHTDLSDPQVQ
jgi:DNA replication protein DnaD